MGLGFGFGSGLRALSAARLGMQVAGNNIANANTVGYSRQRVELSAALPYQTGRGFQIGSGVDVSGIFGVVDQGLERRIQLQTGLVGAARVDQLRMAELEGILGEPEGLSETLQGFFGSIGALQTDPADRALRGGVIQSGALLSQGFRLISDRVGELRGSSFDEVRGHVREVNEHAAAIAELNSQIIGVEANGSAANDLRDARREHVRQISVLLDTRAIERSSGSVDVLVGGHLLVAGSQSTQLGVGRGADGLTRVTAGENAATVNVREGRIAALLRQEATDLPGTLSRIDDLARSTILEFNRLHSTGMPRSGPFQSLRSAYGVLDGNNNNVFGDELLSQAGLEFAVQSGELYVNVSNLESGGMERTRIAIDPASMTLRDVADELTAIDHLSASIDPTGRLRISADNGYGFDFSPRLDPDPDGNGTFGGTNPAIGATGAGPYDISGQTFPVTFTVTTGSATAPVNTTVTLQATDFANSSTATTAELIAAINDDLGTAGTAQEVAGRLVIQGSQGGDSSILQLTNGSGTVLGDLGLSTAQTTGRDDALPITVEGTYTGADNDRFTFVPAGDGQIGRTAGLKINVFNSAGDLVTELDVGQTYQPGEMIEVADGVQVSFGPGTISGTAGQVFGLDVLNDSDTADLLVGIGMNSFFLGSSASDIEVDPAILSNPDRLAAALGTADGDASNLERFTAMRDRAIGSLDANTIEDFYADLVGDVGFETAGATTALIAEEDLLGYLQAEREGVSGVNIDEEMVSMVQYQQSYEAAARFISVAQQMLDTLINLGR